MKRKEKDSRILGDSELESVRGGFRQLPEKPGSKIVDAFKDLLDKIRKREKK